MTISTYAYRENEISMQTYKTANQDAVNLVVSEQKEAFYAQVRKEFLEVSARYLDLPNTYTSSGH